MQSTRRQLDPIRTTGEFPSVSMLFVASMLRLVSTSGAVLAGMVDHLAVGCRANWTSDFFMADGLFARYQLWLAVAIGRKRLYSSSIGEQ